MPTYNPSGDAGMASLNTETFGIIELFSGEAPIMTISEIVDAAVIADADLPEYTVVGRDSDGELVVATWNATPASAIAPVGITCSRVKQDATARNVDIYKGGMFNPAALTWHSTFDTDAKKRLAFEKSAPGIFIQKIPTYGD